MAEKKGTQKTEVIIGAAAAKMASASKQLKEAFGESEKLAAMLEDQALKVSDYEGKISELGLKYDQAKAEQDFKLQLEYKTDKSAFALSYLDEYGMLAVEKDEYNKIKNGYSSLRSEFDKRLSEKVNETRIQIEKDSATNTQLLKSEFNVKEAQNAANIKQLEAQLASAISTADMWKEQLIAERAAGVERARASSIGSVNVTAAK